ncbi:pentapeptide repeat-containing protein [Microcella humidisoli]|uniref:Pentapeptide repeat-containing protein n=1 Tax=Microcella humidisoli TaxID=2963406 RepID=A0ABY5FXI9_9MICO|nr:pentapeptide repeat-containing protein [Microcella humidisoli]UTT62793.1 pentapeptide repeat-containing protein [Microcella humidisoli]
MTEPTRTALLPRGDRRQLLVPSCGDCLALCCVALAFTRSADFAHDKPAGEPCRNLADDRSCTIHAELRPRGYRGCSVYDCFGAGQRLSQAAVDSAPDTRTARTALYAALPIARALHELQWWLAEALAHPDAGPQRRALLDAAEATQRLGGAGPEALLALDLDAVRASVLPLLAELAAAARRGLPAPTRVRGRTLGPRADLLGARLDGADLRGADLRGALLIAASLRGADLAATDLLAADLRDADLSGADASAALFLTQPQVTAAMGDASTLLPPGIRRPDHWVAAHRD